MKATIIVLRVVAILWWLGVGSFGIPWSLYQGGLLGEPMKPRQVSQEDFESTAYRSRHRVTAAFLSIMVLIALVPHRVFVRNHFMSAFTLTCLPLMYLSGRAALFFYKVSMGHEDIVYGSVVLALAFVGSACLPACLAISRLFWIRSARDEALTRSN